MSLWRNEISDRNGTGDDSCKVVMVILFRCSGDIRCNGIVYTITALQLSDTISNFLCAKYEIMRYYPVDENG